MDAEEQVADKQELLIYVIYDHPSDFPNEWVCRIQKVKDGAVVFSPALYCRSKHSIEDIREQLQLLHLVRIPRDASDDPCIAESWL